MSFELLKRISPEIWFAMVNIAIGLGICVTLNNSNETFDINLHDIYLVVDSTHIGFLILIGHLISTAGVLISRVNWIWITIAGLQAISGLYLSINLQAPSSGRFMSLWAISLLFTLLKIIYFIIRKIVLR